jgi:hypothetical protein
MTTRGEKANGNVKNDYPVRDFVSATPSQKGNFYDND